jgi:hypothetical protein
MSISVTTDATRQLIVATAVGDLTLAELRDFLRTVRTGEQRLWPLLFDASAASTEVTSAQVGALAAGVGAMVRREGPRGPVAMVATNPALFGVMRMYQTLCETEGFDAICVARTRAEAEEWLRERARER